MNDKDLETKERLIQVTIELLDQVDDVNDITVRQIAERAEVGIGSINYHFQSKDNLLNEAVMRVVGDVAASWYQPFQHQEVDPVTRLRQLFKESSKIVALYPKLSQVSVSHALLQSDFDVASLIIPLLREIFGERKTETELRLISFQLVVSTQVAYMRADAFRRYSGIDVFDDMEREAVIDILVDNLINKVSTI
jgi:AcrR family transcriptional regulator